MVKVIAQYVGYYGGKIREVGEEFEMADEHYLGGAKAPVWVEVVGDAPQRLEQAAVKAGSLNREQEELAVKAGSLNREQEELAAGGEGLSGEEEQAAVSGEGLSEALSEGTSKEAKNKNKKG